MTKEEFLSKTNHLNIKGSSEEEVSELLSYYTTENDVYFTCPICENRIISTAAEDNPGYACYMCGASSLPAKFRVPTKENTVTKADYLKKIKADPSYIYIFDEKGKS